MNNEHGTESGINEREEIRRMERRLNAVVRQLKRDCPTMMRRQAGIFKRMALTYLRTRLPPFRGRPTDKEIDRAEQLYNRGIRGTKLVRELYPESLDWEPRNRRHEAERISRALRQRRRQAKRKSRELETGHEEN